MCGIAGIFGLEALDDARATVARMTDAIAHRGPDASGIHLAGNCILGHRRLSIIDLSHGPDQPFRSADGRHAIVFNGEIYNYRALRERLGALGHTFRTASDTEVLLAAYREWGPVCLNELEGMFAFAITDEVTQDLFLARDRMGIKPLYLYHDDRHLLFASEVRALLASGLVPRRIDTDAFVDHLRYQTVHAPDTIVRGVKMLEAGHAMLVSDQEVRSWRWYDPVAASYRSAGAMARTEVLREVRDRLSTAVEKRLVADVPFGAFLSGGIDSSAVVGLMAQASTAPVQTFSVVFDEAEYSEERYARIVADRFRTEHTPIRLSPADMLRMLPEALADMDHPSADGANTWVVSKVTREAGIKMALSGLGGDEVFAGYPVFTRTLELWRRRWVTQFPSTLRRWGGAMARAARPSITSSKMAEMLRLDAFTVDETYPVARRTFSDQDLVALLARDTLPRDSVRRIMKGIIREDRAYELPMLSQVSLGELATYLQNVLLRDTDQMSMAHALEVRVPFLDHHLVEFVLGVEDVHKYPHTPKALLTDALGDLLPREVTHRPKMGFTLPWETWMRVELRGMCEQRLARLANSPLFRPGSVDALWQRFLRRDPRVNWSRLWSLVVLADWMERQGMEE